MPRVISDELYQELQQFLSEELQSVRAQAFRHKLFTEPIEVEETTGSYITTGDDPVYNRTWEEL